MKTKISIYICDDDKNSIIRIEKFLYHFFINECEYKITSFQSGEDLLSECNKYCPDVVFLDIDMPNMTGFEVAEHLQAIKKDLLIIFITNYEDKVYQSWVYQPFWFIRKNHIEDLNIVLPKLLAKIERGRKDSKVKLILNNSIAELDLNSIIYIESLKHDIVLNNINGEKTVFRCRISDAEAQLSEYYVVRIQKGILVNLRFVLRVTSRQILLTNGLVLSLSRDRVEHVKNKFMFYLREI